MAATSTLRSGAGLLPCHSAALVRKRATSWRRSYSRSAVLSSVSTSNGCQSAPDARNFLTLEHPVRPSPEHSALISSGAFAAEVVPDLPAATTWGNLFKLALQ